MFGLEGLAARIVGGAVVVSVIFGAGYACRNQSAGKTIRLLKYERQAAIDDAKRCATSLGELEKAIAFQNAAIEKMARDGAAAVERLNATHNAVIQRQEARYAAALERARREAEALRERLVGLSVAESCHESWLEVAR